MSKKYVKEQKKKNYEKNVFNPILKCLTTLKNSENTKSCLKKCLIIVKVCI